VKAAVTLALALASVPSSNAAGICADPSSLEVDKVLMTRCKIDNEATCIANGYGWKLAKEDDEDDECEGPEQDPTLDSEASCAAVGGEMEITTCETWDMYAAVGYLSCDTMSSAMYSIYVEPCCGGKAGMCPEFDGSTASNMCEVADDYTPSGVIYDECRIYSNATCTAAGFTWLPDSDEDFGFKCHMPSDFSPEECTAAGGKRQVTTCEMYDQYLASGMVDCAQMAHLPLSEKCCSGGKWSCVDSDGGTSICADPSQLKSDAVFSEECKFYSAETCVANGGTWGTNEDDEDLDCNDHDVEVEDCAAAGGYIETTMCAQLAGYRAYYLAMNQDFCDMLDAFIAYRLGAQCCADRKDYCTYGAKAESDDKTTTEDEDEGDYGSDLGDYGNADDDSAAVGKTALLVAAAAAVAVAHA